MDKPRLNFIIDCLMFLFMAAILGLGLLMKYVLIPGRKTFAVYGRRVELSWLGWDRHDWGDIHFYLALILLGLLALHIILHWSMIVALFRRLIAAPQTRTITFWIFLLACLLLILFPFFLTPDIGRYGQGRERAQHQSFLDQRLPVLPPGLLGQ
jgi:hypothetical protein